MVFLSGSLRSPTVPLVSRVLRGAGFRVFDDWYAAGPEADDCWQRYETFRGRTYEEALTGKAAAHVFQFDLHHLHECDMAVLALPAGKSSHMELGYALGSGKPGFVLFDKAPDRWDVMYRFATGIAFSTEELLKLVRRAADAI